MTDAILDDATALADYAAEWIAGRIAAAKGVFRFALTGGYTPRPTYQRLAARQDVDWGKVEFYWGDERFVAHDNPSSNYRLAYDTLLGPLKIDTARIHPWPVTGQPDAAARHYETMLKRHYGAKDFDPKRPFFDLQLLGLGDDGHVCSLFPGQESLRETKRWTLAIPTGRPEIRLTLTFPAVESSKTIALLVSGKAKAPAVAGVRKGDTALPGALIKPQGELVWLMDRDAASLL